MTIKDLQKLIQSQQNTDQDKNLIALLRRLRDKPFYNWDMDHRNLLRSKSDCCSNHIIGLPRKNGIEKPLFDYERMIFRAVMVDSYLNSKPISTTTSHTAEEKRIRDKAVQSQYLHAYKNRHVWIKKATGLGVTEFMLRLMVWLCIRNDDLNGTNMCIVTGPRIEQAIGLIERIKKLFEPHDIYFDTKQTTVVVNNVNITAYPSNHLDSMRSLDKVSFIFIDEADFFSKGEQQNARDIAERYIGKSDPYIVMVSTPNAPGGLFDKIEKEPFDSCIYKKVFLDYTYGVDKIYTQKEIDKAKRSPSFPREYELQYLGLVGNVFSPKSIENCQKIEYNPEQIAYNCKVSVGIDPSFGSSKFGIVATRFVNERIEVAIAEEHERPQFSDMIDRVWAIKQQLGNISAIYVDAANPEIWQSLKKEWNELYSDTYVFTKLAECKKINVDPNNYMKIIPVPFSVSGKAMLQHAKSLVEDPDNLVAIDKRFDKLLTALRTAVSNEYKLDKEQTSYHDILDAFRLSLNFYRRNK